MTPVLVGVDAGGSRTSVVVTDGDRILGRAEGVGAAVRPGRALVSATTIAELVRRGLAASGQLRCDALVVGAAGAGRQIEQDELRQALRGEAFAERIVVTTDIEVALMAAFEEGPGIVLTAGTGSIAVGRDPTGMLHRCGGYGWQMGDEGSGYAIGRGALGAVSRASDGRSPPTELTRVLLNATRSENFDSLVRWAARATTGEIASLAPQVLEVAAQGDTVAHGIADYAARELTQLVLHLLPHFAGSGPVGVATNGGLMMGRTMLYEQVTARLEEESAIRLIREPINPPLGAAKMAGRLAGLGTQS
jgi:glucosamine kinase